MTEERVILAELLEKAGDGDFLRAAAEAVLQLLMESDVEGLIGAGRSRAVSWHPGELYPRVGFIVTNLVRPAERMVAFYKPVK